MAINQGFDPGPLFAVACIDGHTLCSADPDACAAGVLLLLTLVLDVIAIAPVRVLLQPLRWLGTNCLAAYAGDILLQHVMENCFYWRDSSQNARVGVHVLLQRLLLRRHWGEAGANNLYAALDVLFWVVVAGLMQLKGLVWEI